MNLERALTSLFTALSKYCYGDEIEEVEMGGSCRKHVRDEQLPRRSSEFLNGREPLEGYRGRLEENIESILKQMTQYGDHRRAFVNTVMNFCAV